MGLLSRVSLRNLTRQKRRNTLLGLGIGFGMMILVIANSFSNGLVDVLINEIVANVAGHVSVIGMDNNVQMIHNKKKIDEMLASFEDQIEYTNESIATFTKVIGNDKSDNMVIVGVPNEEEMWTEFMAITDGGVEEFDTDTYSYPVVISPDKAKSLNVKVGDVLKTRLNMVTGQVQSANMQVIAIGESNNTFMNVVAFMEVNKLRKLLGYKEYETGGYQLTIKDPKLNAKDMANKMHEMLKPDILSVVGKANDQTIKLFAYENDKDTYHFLFDQLNVIQGEERNYLSKAGVLISEELSNKIGVGIGKKFLYSYDTMYRGNYQEEVEVEGIFRSSGKFRDDVIIVNAERIYKNYNTHQPKNTLPHYFDSKDTYYKSLAKEYYLYDRVDNASEYRKAQRAERRKKSKRASINVVTMYEVASEILMIEKVLNGVTWVVVLVLFFIILIGVVNTLRMTIKERTREIGTLRAIGMQAKDVKNIFILESMFLSIIACIAGTFLGILVSKGLGLITFDSTSTMSFILKDGRITFIYDIKQILFNIVLITLITIVTAYFPARKASKISAATALRHYE